jgi:hypothetical protein
VRSSSLHGRVAFSSLILASVPRLTRDPGAWLVLDCGLFHTFDDEDERTRYAASLATVTERGGTLYVLCFSDEGPETGPHPISQEELRAAFNGSSGWGIAANEPDRLETRYHDHAAPAWFATIKRI